MKRPRGVEASIILIFLFGGFSLLIISVVLVMLGFYPGYEIIKDAAFGKPSFIVWSIAWLVVWISLIIAGIGLLKYKEWARKLTVYSSFAGIAALVWGAIRVGRVSFGVIPLALFVWLILYFNKKEVVKDFINSIKL